MAKGNGVLLHRLKALRSHLQSAALGDAQTRIEEACAILVTTANDMVDIPQCPQCAREMNFSSVESYDAHHDNRTFECAPCQYSRTLIVRREDRRRT
jgi:transposase-like protein